MFPQAQLADIYNTTQQNISLHQKGIYADGELDENATHKKYLLVRQEGKRQVQREIDHYNHLCHINWLRSTFEDDQALLRYCAEQDALCRTRTYSSRTDLWACGQRETVCRYDQLQGQLRDARRCEDSQELSDGVGTATTEYTPWIQVVFAVYTHCIHFMINGYFSNS